MRSFRRFGILEMPSRSLKDAIARGAAAGLLVINSTDLRCERHQVALPKLQFVKEISVERQAAHVVTGVEYQRRTSPDFTLCQTLLLVNGLDTPDQPLWELL